MEQRNLITVSKPPLEIFDGVSVIRQEQGEEAIPGDYFEKVEYPEEGGVFVHYYDHPYPFKGHPFPEAVDAIMMPKKAIVATMHFVKRHPVFTAILLLLPQFITRRYFRSAIELFVGDCIREVIRPYLLSDEKKRWNRCVLEIRRAASKALLETKLPWWKKFIPIFIDIISAIIEWDNAYRYRLEDIFGEFDKAAFIRNPSKEIDRLIKIWVQRERGWHEYKGKLITMAAALRLLLFFVPGLRRFFCAFAEELDLEKVRLDEADRYYCLVRPDYDADGEPITVRQKKYFEVINKYKQEHPERIQRGIESKEQELSMEMLRQHLQKIEGIPFMLFIAAREGERTRVKMLETKLSADYPELRNLCMKILESKTAKPEVPAVPPPNP